jgi:hypothetical protein
MITLRHSPPFILLALVVLLAGACASTSSTASSASPSRTMVASVDALAGTWQGFANQAGVSLPVTVNVRPDGSYTSSIGAATGSGTLRVVQGNIVTTGHLSGPAFGSERQTTARLVDQDGRRMLVGDGRDDRGPFSYQLQKTN